MLDRPAAGVYHAPAMPLQSRRIQDVQSPIIPVVAELIRTNPGTISLGQGVVSYGPPPQAIDRIIQVLADPECHKLKPVHGIPAPLAAIDMMPGTENCRRATPARCRGV